MALKETVNEIREILHSLSRDLEKGVKGNKTAAQRFRTNSIKFTKISKVYRKESIESERGGKKVKKGVKAPLKKKKAAKKK